MVPYKVYTHYSIQKAFTKIDDLVERAKQLDLKALCITDENTLSGCVEFLQTCQKAKIKPILGMTIFVEKYPDIPVILLAKNKSGWYNLIKILGRINTDGVTSWDTIQKYSENLLFISDNSFVIDLLLQWIAAENVFSDGFNHTSAVQPIHGSTIYYVNESDRLYQDIITCSKLKIKLDELDRSLYDFTNNYLQLHPSFESSNILDTLCEAYDIREPFKMPIFDVDKPDDYITQLCRDGWKAKLSNKVKDNYLKDIYTARIKEELSVFKELGISNYMLIIRDIIMYARKHNISVGLRGSASGCLISYLIDISDIDPIQPDPTMSYDPHKSLLFERFINKGRFSKGEISFSEFSYKDYLKQVNE